jgi:tRNA pseudouridine55 synthase
MFLLIDKPKGITSHDVVDRIRKITGEYRVGHAGTLDPNATGLLIVGVGRESTKKLSEFLKSDKEYEAEIFLGEERETDDTEGVIRNTQHATCNTIKPNNKLIRLILESFVGEQMQTPPAYSAIKIKGKKAYQLARKNLSLSLSPRKITIYSIQLLEYEYPILKIKTKVSSGTYIRSLARDIGRIIGCGAYLKNLRRLSIGSYSVENAVKISKLEQKKDLINILNFKL